MKKPVGKEQQWKRPSGEKSAGKDLAGKDLAGKNRRAKDRRGKNWREKDRLGKYRSPYIHDPFDGDFIVGSTSLCWREVFTVLVIVHFCERCLNVE